MIHGEGGRQGRSIEERKKKGRWRGGRVKEAGRSNPGISRYVALIC